MVKLIGKYNNYNYSTEPFDNINITEEDNLSNPMNSIIKKKKEYVDISNVNKRMSISQISNNESNFNIDNHINDLIFTCDEKITINLTIKYHIF